MSCVMLVPGIITCTCMDLLWLINFSCFSHVILTFQCTLAAIYDITFSVKTLETSMTYGLIGTITRSLNNAVYIPIFYIQLDLYSAELTLIPMLDRQYHTVVLHSRDPPKMTYTL